jgi:nitrite reductase (NO-forming)
MGIRRTSRQVGRTLAFIDPVESVGRRVPLPVVQPARQPLGRGDDRRVTFGGLLVAAVLLALAGLSAIGSALGGTIWLPLHLALAGAAGSAIAAVLPFFTTALARVAPPPPGLRIGAIGLVSGSTLLAAIGMTGGQAGLAALGGAAYVCGLLAVAGAAFLPLRSTVGSMLRLVPLAYGVALVQVGTGVALATAMLAGWSPVAGAWAALKPAHAWLNVFGFVTVVVAASLIHLAPTVAGARIRPRRSTTVALVGLMIGAPLVALGVAAGWDAVARAGALAELVGGAALAIHGAAVQRDRGVWTSDPGWHRFAGLSLVAAPAWLVVALAISAGRILWLGATPEAWSVGLLALPLAAGWIGQVLVGAWTQLVPAIGPGDQRAHAIQRRWLGLGSRSRWLAWNGGVTVGTAGLLSGADALAAAGGVALGAALLTALGLLWVAVAAGRSSVGRVGTGLVSPR